MKLSWEVKILLVLATAIAVVTGISLLPDAMPRLVSIVRADVLKAFDRQLFHLGRLPITPIFLLKTFLFILVLGMVSGRCRRFVKDRVLSRTSLDAGQRYAFAQITSYLVYLSGLLIGLQWAGLDLNNLYLLGGAVGIGLGFGLQNIASNFVSGLILLAERPIRVGDRVEVGGTNGDVIRIGPRSTRVRTNNNVVIIIPNSEFINGRVTNWTADDRRVRFAVPVGVAWDSEPAKVRDLLLEVARHHPDVLDVPPPEVLFTGFGEGALKFELRVWTVRHVQTPRVLTSDLYFSIFGAFMDHGIAINNAPRELPTRPEAISPQIARAK